MIYLFQSGGPAQMDLFDYKPHLRERAGEEVPKSVYPDERKTTMTSAQSIVCRGPEHFQVRPAWPGGDVDERAAAAHRLGRR